MSEIFNNFDSNSAFEDSRQNYEMASPSQSSPVTNSNSLTPNSQHSNNMQSNASGTNANATKGSGSSSASDTQPIITKPRLLELVREVDPAAQLDEDLEEFLLQIADDFIDDVIRGTCAVAKHRKVNRVEVRDCQLQLERKWNMWIPGFGTDELRPYKRAAITEAHKQRLALIRKTIKKY